MHDGRRSGIGSGFVLLLAGILVITPAWAGTKAGDKKSRPQEPTPSAAQETPQQRRQTADTPLSAAAQACDRLASDPKDIARAAPPIPLERMELSKAVEVCQQAVADHPTHPRMSYQYGRALMAASERERDWLPKFKEGVTYVEKSAKQGYGAAILKLGFVLSANAALKREQEAEYWLQRAVEKNYPEALGALGAYYHRQKNYAKAIPLYVKGIQQGEGYSLYSMGALYDDGLGVPQDRDKAIILYREAAAKGFKHAEKRLKEIQAQRKMAPRLREFSTILGARGPLGRNVIDRDASLGCPDGYQMIDQIGRKIQCASAPDPVNQAFPALLEALTKEWAK